MSGPKSLLERKFSLEGFKELVYQNGYSTTRIAEILNAGRSSIGRYMRRHNLKRRLTRYNLTFAHISEAELAYLAGLFDGEGNITVTVSKSGVARVEVSLCNSDEAVLSCRGFFTHHRVRDKMGHNGTTKMHILYTHNYKDALDLMSAILPYLRLKKARAELMMKICQSRMERYRKPLSVEEHKWIEQPGTLNSRKGKRR